MIEIYLLEQLAAVEEYRTLSQAAEHLHVAQPSVSRAMQKLEDLLGVKLFIREKNRIELNETGKIAAAHARRILEAEKEMESHVRSFDRSLHTFSVGSCTPGPLMLFLPKTAGTLSGMTVVSEVSTREQLRAGLDKSEYSMIILDHPVETEKLTSRKIGTEHLNCSLSPFHPAACLDRVSFAQMDGQGFIMYARVGIWEDIVRGKMPHSKFYKQEDIDAVGELSRYSDLPSFTSSITEKIMPSRQNTGRITVPFSDPEASITYYAVYPKKNAAMIQKLF